MKNKKTLLGFAFAFLIGSHVLCWASAPKLIVIVVGDQIRADYLQRYRSYLAPGGLRRFLEQGAYFKNALQDSAVTKTSPGHVLIGSGLYPRQSGIIGNEWFDTTSGKTVSPVELITGGERVQLMWFIGQSFAQRLHQKNPQSRVVSVSLKDRGALLLTGPDQDDAYWWDRKKEKFINTKSPPGWLEEFNNGMDAILKQHDTWTPNLKPSSQLSSAFDQQNTFTKGHIRNNAALGLSFPHPITSTKALMISPYSDEIVEQLAEKITQEWDLGHNAAHQPDVLTVSFSAVDIVGHEFGPDSMETWDAFINLDRSVEKLMAFIDARVGKEVVWVFSSDHGVTSFPEVSRAKGLDAGRVHITMASLSSLGSVRAVSLPYIYVDEPAIPIVRDAIQKIPGVKAVYTMQDIAQGHAPREVTQSVFVSDKNHEPRGGNLFVVLKPYYIFSEDDDCGTTHGQPTVDDQHVPLGFYGFEVKPKTYDAPTSVGVVAPTLLRRLGIDAKDLTKPVDLFTTSQ